MRYQDSSVFVAGNVDFREGKWLYYHSPGSRQGRQALTDAQESCHRCDMRRDNREESATTSEKSGDSKCESEKNGENVSRETFLESKDGVKLTVPAYNANRVTALANIAVQRPIASGRVKRWTYDMFIEAMYDLDRKH